MKYFIVFVALLMQMQAQAQGFSFFSSHELSREEGIQIEHCLRDMSIQLRDRTGLAARSNGFALEGKRLMARFGTEILCHGRNGRTQISLDCETEKSEVMHLECTKERTYQ